MRWVDEIWVVDVVKDLYLKEMLLLPRSSRNELEQRYVYIFRWILGVGEGQ